MSCNKDQHVRKKQKTPSSKQDSKETSFDLVVDKTLREMGLARKSFLSISRDQKLVQQHINKKTPFYNSSFIRYLEPYINNPVDVPHSNLHINPKNLHQNLTEKDQLYISKEKNSERVMMSNFFTNGAVFCSHEYFLMSFQHKANDLANGVILTDNQIAHQFWGHPVVVDMDFTHPEKLPPFGVVANFLRLSSDLCHQMYPPPKKAKTDAIFLKKWSKMAVSFCQPKIKIKRRINRVEGRVISWGVHVVFPNIVTGPKELKIFLRTLDNLVSASDPEWGPGTVDADIVNTMTLNLRPNGSHKAVSCQFCQKKKILNERQDVFAMARLPPVCPEESLRATPEIETLDMIDFEHKESSATEQGGGRMCPGRCIKGKIVLPGVYRLKIICFRSLEGNIEGEQVFYSNEQILLELQLTSIVLEKPYIDSQRARFLLSEHSPDPMTPAPITKDRQNSGLVYRQNSRTFAKIRNGNLAFELHNLPNLRKELEKIIRVQFRGAYRFCSISAISASSSADTLFINIRGPGSKKCPYHYLSETPMFNPSKKGDQVAGYLQQTLSEPQEHTSSDVYFMLYCGVASKTRRNRVSVGCYRPKCKKCSKVLFEFIRERRKADRDIESSLTQTISTEISPKFCRSVQKWIKPKESSASLSKSEQSPKNTTIRNENGSFGLIHF